jgi:hypothetical protein
MRKTFSVLFIAVLVLSGRTLAAPDGNGAPMGPNLSVRSAVLSIEGTSTMHDYSLKTSALTITSAADCGEAAALLVPGTLQAFELRIPVDSFTADKDGLKKQMLKAMNADKHPLIVFKLNTYAVEPSTSGGVIVKPAGTLSVAGVEQPVELVLDVRETAGVLQVRGSRDLLMTDFGIKPPTMFMGMLKTNNKVTVKFDLQLALVPPVLANKGL